MRSTFLSSGSPAGLLVSGHKGQSFVCCAGIVAMLASFGLERTFAESFRVEWTAQRLSVLATDAPLSAVLAEVARQTKSEFIGLEQVSDHVWFDFRDKTLAEGLRMLL